MILKKNINNKRPTYSNLKTLLNMEKGLKYYKITQMNWISKYVLNYKLFGQIEIVIRFLDTYIFLIFVFDQIKNIINILIES